MHLSKIKTFAVALTLCAAANAQFNAPGNARIAGMGGAPVADISNVFSYPVQMMGYTDQIQATFPNGGFIGIKSLSETFAIGIAGNQGPMAGDGFTGMAIDTLNARDSISGFNETYANIPHLLLGFDVGSLQIGADVFFEYARSSYKYDNGNTEQEASGMLYNPGARLSLGLETGDIGILVKAGFSIPSISGEYPVGQDTRKISSEKGMYFELGAEAGLPLMGADWTFGAQYVSVGYQSKNGDTKGNDQGNSLVDVYVSSEFNVLETATAALGYTFSREASLSFPNKNAVERNPINHYHIFNGGIENVWTDAWFFDAFALRCGAAYTADVRITSGKDTDGDNDTSHRTKFPADQSGISAMMGAGFSKEFLTIDVAIQPGAWGGLFTGPSVFMASGTIKF